MEESHVDAAARLLGANDLDAAFPRLQQALIQNPANPRARVLQGVYEAKRGNLAAAVNAIEHAARIQPNDAGIQYNLALVLAQSQRAAEARQAAERALTVNPAHAGAKDLLARLGGAGTPQPPASAGAWTPATASPTPAASAWAPSSNPPVPPHPPGSPSPFPSGVQNQATSAPGQPASSGLQLPSGWPGAQTGSPGTSGLRVPPPADLVEGPLPAVGLRVARGLGWGPLYGQWWTLWSTLSLFLWSGGNPGGNIILYVVILAVFNAFFGAITGLIIAVVGSRQQEISSRVGIGVGLCMCLLRAVMFQSGFQLFNLLFYFVTGRYVGTGLHERVMKPLAS